MEKITGNENVYPTDVWIETKNGFQIKGTDAGLTIRQHFAATLFTVY